MFAKVRLKTTPVHVPSLPSSKPAEVRSFYPGADTLVGKIFLDGVLDSVHAVAFEPQIFDSFLYVNNWGESDNGLIDEIHVSNVVRSDDEILSRGRLCSVGHSITSVSPSRGGNAGTVTTAIYGCGLQTGAVARLRRLGQPDVIGVTNGVAAAGKQLTVQFDLRGASARIADVVIANPDGSSVTLPAAFTIEQGGAPEVWVDVIGFDRIRIGREQTYYLVYGNTGNVDAQYATVWLSLPASVVWRALPPSVLSTTTSVGSSSETIVSFDVVNVTPGSSVAIPVLVQIPMDRGPFQLRVWSSQ